MKQWIIKFFKKCWNILQGFFPAKKSDELEPTRPRRNGNATRKNVNQKTEPLRPKPPGKTGGYSASSFAHPRTLIFPREVLFKNPSPKINSLQRKTLESLFSEYNLSVEEYGSYVAYFPSRLLTYIEQQDAFSSFRKFLGDLGVTPEEIFRDRSKASFTREAIVILFDADTNCWDTPLSTEPLYRCLQADRNLDNLKKILNKLEDFTRFSHKLQRLADKISFYLFRQFSEELSKKLQYWDSITREDFDHWKALLNEYESASKLYHNCLEQIDRDCDRSEKVTLTLDQHTVIKNLLQEVEQIKEQLNDGFIEIDEGLHQLEILSDEINYFVNEVLHRTRDDKSSSKEKFATKNDKLSTEEALNFLNLTIETLSLESLKTAHRRYARIYHPDVGGDNATMQKYNEAYEILKEHLATRYT